MSASPRCAPRLLRSRHTGGFNPAAGYEITSVSTGVSACEIRVKNLCSQLIKASTLAAHWWSFPSKISSP